MKRSFSDLIMNADVIEQSTEEYPTLVQPYIRRILNMPIWKPSGHVTESPAKWEANPARTTYFLELLLDLMNHGKFKGSPTVSAYSEISKLFWARYAVYHTPKQLKNYYANRKTLWSNVCWARERTGIGWDDSQKMILASEDWWQAHETRKGIMALKDRPIPDYELLDKVFAGQRAVADHCYGPYQPIPLNSSEGSGDSDNPEDTRFFDPQTQPSQADVSINTSSGKKRAAQTSADPTRKKTKKKGDGVLPHTAKLRHRFNVFLDVKASRRRMTFDTEAARPSSGVGSVIPSGTTINSKTNMELCMRVMTSVLNLDATSVPFYHALDMLVSNPDWQGIFLGFTEPEHQLKWLQHKVRSTFPHDDGIPFQQSGYDLNHPVMPGDL